jgi:hypothetical protein
MHQMNDYEREMVNQRLQQDIRDAQQWRQAHSADTDPAPHVTSNAHSSFLARVIRRLFQFGRRVSVNESQPDPSVTHSVETPGT